MRDRPALKKALSCKCTVNLTEIVESVMQASRQGAAPLPYPPQGEQRFDLLVNNDNARVTYLDSEGDPLWSFVRRGESRASSFWDHEKRFTLHFPEDDVARTHVAPASAVHIQVHSKGGQSVAELAITDVNVGTLRHVLKFTRRPALNAFGRSLLRILYGGPSCHKSSKFPLEQLEKLGVLVEASVYLGGHSLPVSQLTIGEAKAIAVRKQDFDPPRSFVDYSNKTKGATRTPRPSASGIESPAIGLHIPTPGAPRVEADRRVLDDVESILPDCMGSTRFGSMAALVHQDLLTHATKIINTIAPLLGTATLNNGTLTIPWLSSLQAIPVASPIAAGSGISCLLRSVRLPTTAMGGPSGGGGLLDRLAHRNLTQPDASGTSRLQREVASGSISNTMQAWGITTTSFVSDLVAANGDLSMLPLNEQIAILEGYELSELGTVQIDGFPKDAGDFDPLKGSGADGLITGHLWSLTGAVNFGSLAGGPLVPVAAIGSSGDINLTLVLPTTTLTATSTWQLTTKGSLLLRVGTVATCILLPFACPAAIILASVLGWFVFKQLSVISATTSGVTLSFNISYQWDPQNNLVNPFVSVTATTGSIVVDPAFIPSSFALTYIQTIVAGVANTLNLWLPVVAAATATALESTLRSQGFNFPLAAAQMGIQAVDGSAHSAAGTSLTLLADVAPRQMSSSQPYVTQVPTSALVSGQLEVIHTLMRSALNPQPTMPPPPGPGPVITVANYAAIAVSQNALNYYIFSRWLAGDYEVAITDPAVIAKLVALAPPNSFPGTITRIHAWPAVTPRVEVAEESLASLGRPVMVFLDDVRVCFENTSFPGLSSHFTPVQVANAELSFNCKTTATVTLSWPMVVNVLVDDQSSTDSEVRVWDFTDINQPNVASAIPANAWSALAAAIAALILGSQSASGVLPFANPPAWPRPIPGGLAEEFAPDHPSLRPIPEVFYMEILGRRRVLFLPTGLSSSLLELVDGSGAPTLNTILGTTPATSVTMSTMTCAQGRKLRVWLPFLGLGPQHSIPGP